MNVALLDKIKERGKALSRVDKPYPWNAMEEYLQEWMSCANPAVVLELIAEIERLEKARNDALSKVEQLRDRVKQLEKELEEARNGK